jgi:cyclopropane-fatty-acyl-phospholipid synthase
LRSLDKKLLLATLARFLFVPRGGPFPLRDIPIGAEGGNATANRRNIRYHYDKLNEFRAFFLDPRIVYSYGHFIDWNEDLSTAQFDKRDIICRELLLRPDDRFLEIGFGWGPLVCHAAKHYGVRAHGVTLSNEPLAFDAGAGRGGRIGGPHHAGVARLRLPEGGLAKIASIGMFEHVGLANHLTYFSAVKRLLKPGGLYLHHAITRPAKRDDKRFRRRSSE